ncbi:hypothetical protein R9X47_02330 [Wukongibacter baidiensis]|uniref:hypothetical protein n=1 Tax=Wukongibacter baidiensis TaxID=1723361 RepID=UPI003D7FEAAA
MEFTDEKIVEMIKAEKRLREKKSIKDKAIRVKDKLYEFEEKSFYEDKLYMTIPKDFEDMTQEAKAIKYPYIQRPEIIKTNLEGSVDITFNRIDQDITEDLVEELTMGMKDMTKRMNPSNLIFSHGIRKASDKNIGFFDFKSSAIDEPIYNVMFFLEFEEKVLMGKFACLYRDYKAWRDVAFQMIESIRVELDEE